MEYSFQKNRINGGINADEEFWKGLEEGEFRLPRCAQCDAWTWPAHFRCGDCGSWDFKWVVLEPQGRVFSWTRSWYAFDRVRERSEDVPYVTVLAEIPAANGARVMGILKGSEEGLRVGAAVSGVIEAPSAKTKGYPSITWHLRSE
jgi:uncharacterized OB-fold protein